MRKIDTVKKVKITDENYEQFLEVVRNLDYAMTHNPHLDFGIDGREIKTSLSSASREYNMWAGTVRACKCILAKGDGDSYESYYAREDVKRDVIAENENFCG